MSNNELFIWATRNKVRFQYKGNIGVEDLWDLSPQNLDNIFKELNAKAKQSKEESLLSTKSKEDEVLSNQIEIIKYIVNVKLEEKAAREKAVENKEKVQKLLDIKARREEAALENISDEELERQIRELSK